LTGLKSAQPDVWEFPIPGGLVLAVPDLDGLFLLNPSARLIWAELRLGSDAEAIAGRLVETFGIDSARARIDVEETLKQWAELLKKNRQAVAPVAHLAPGGHFERVVCLNGVRLRIDLDSAELAAEILPRVAHLAIEHGSFDFTLTAAAEETVSEARALLLQEMVRLFCMRELARGAEAVRFLRGLRMRVRAPWRRC
jgi:hypothetical protein